jgi:hypothetical protein
MNTIAPQQSKWNSLKMVSLSLCALITLVGCSHSHPESFLLDCKGAVFNANGDSIRDPNVHQLATMTVSKGHASFAGDDYLPGGSLTICPKDSDGSQHSTEMYFSDNGCDVNPDRAPPGFRGSYNFDSTFLKVLVRQSPGGPPVIGSYRCTLIPQ